MTETSNTAGLNWMLAEEFAQDGKAWREQWAVLDSFSANGFYVEFTVPTGGLNVWVGKASTQIGNTAGGVQKLSGGATQIFIDFTFGVNLQAQEAAKALPRIPTGWTFDVPIGVTPMSVDVESLSPDEVEPRTSSTSGDAP